MTTKQPLLYLFLPLISATSSLHAASHDVLSDEGQEQKAETLQHPYQNQQRDKNHLYDYTLRNRKRGIDHTVDPDDLDDEKEYLADNRLIAKVNSCELLHYSCMRKLILPNPRTF